MIRKINGKIVSVVALALVSAVTASAQTAPTSLDGFKSVATGYVADGTDVAIVAGILSLGWVAFKIVRKYAAKA